MLLNEMALEQSQERYEAYAMDALRTARPTAPSTIRRAIGRRLIAIGRRIASEPMLELASARR